VSRLDLLRRLGVFVAPGFLSIDTCRALCADMSSDAGTPGDLYDGDRTVIDLETKRLMRTAVSPPLEALVNDRLAAVQPDLERHFDTTLRGREGVMFYRYSVGDLFATHRDTYGHSLAGEMGHQRRASLVLFLNDPAGRSGPLFEGGALILYDMLGEQASNYGLDVPPEAGLLVAFRPELRHEVTPVTAGVRCVAVERFF
jgi:SM-20-related protein